MTADSIARSNANAEVLLWQSKLRLGVAVVAGVAEFLLRQTNGGRQSIGPLLLTVLIYPAVIGGIAIRVRSTRQAPAWMVTATVLSDLAFAFAATIVVSAPPYYGRILIFAFFSLQLTEFYFGRAQAVIALMTVVLGYLVTVSVAVNHHAPLLWPEELWSLGVFLAAAAVFVLQYGNLRHRLANIARLMERAEEGDFSLAYDSEADTRPDAITMVGRAYNRVRSQLSSMVLTDSLTGCLNRRGFDQALGREMARAGRSGGEFSLLALDLDYFKSVNDTRGHLVGDAVLREVGAVLMQSGRAGDTVARTGGEEFSMILPDTSTTGAHQVAGRLCEKIRDHGFTVGGKAIKLSVSIGVVSKGPDLPENAVDEMKRRADDALYFAKRSGRDCVRLWTSSLMDRRSGSGSETGGRRSRAL